MPQDLGDPCESPNSPSLGLAWDAVLRGVDDALTRALTPQSAAAAKQATHSTMMLPYATSTTAPNSSESGRAPAAGGGIFFPDSPPGGSRSTAGESPHVVTRRSTAGGGGRGEGRGRSGRVREASEVSTGRRRQQQYERHSLWGRSQELALLAVLGTALWVFLVLYVLKKSRFPFHRHTYIVAAFCLLPPVLLATTLTLVSRWHDRAETAGGKED